jgi:hypothetical protein
MALSTIMSISFFDQPHPHVDGDATTNKTPNGNMWEVVDKMALEV